MTDKDLTLEEEIEQTEAELGKLLEDVRVLEIQAGQLKEKAEKALEIVVLDSGTE